MPLTKPLAHGQVYLVRALSRLFPFPPAVEGVDSRDIQFTPADCGGLCGRTPAVGVGVCCWLCASVGNTDGMLMLMLSLAHFTFSCSLEVTEEDVASSGDFLCKAFRVFLLPNILK